MSICHLTHFKRMVFNNLRVFVLFDPFEDLPISEWSSLKNSMGSLIYFGHYTIKRLRLNVLIMYLIAVKPTAQPYRACTREIIKDKFVGPF